MSKTRRLHDHSHFYKYMPAETALKVLMFKTLRWSSPSRFNDPFDVPRTIAHGFNSDDVMRAGADLLNTYLDNPPEDLNDFDETLASVLTIAKEGLPSELREKLRSAVAGMVVELASDGAGLQALRDHWAALVPTMRILCLTESPNHVAMWHHYADCYRGIVLGFSCNEATDSALLVAEPIQYLDAKPDVYTDHGLAKILCLRTDAAARETIRLATLTKSDDWSYEKEWRIVSYANDGDLSDYSDWSFDRSDLSHIYLGPLISDSDLQKVTALAKQYPNAVVFRTSIGMDRELHFQPYEG
jgi:Protein of unknown function (DUF2971)